MSAFTLSRRSRGPPAARSIAPRRAATSALRLHITGDVSALRLHASRVGRRPPDPSGRTATSALRLHIAGVVSTLRLHAASPVTRAAGSIRPSRYATASALRLDIASVVSALRLGSSKFSLTETEKTETEFIGLDFFG
ncbi:hypothetical protein OsI_08939 [Oryza sativa Indica Group]|uniref:Uncharacterized protein n=1 Tax=Oryza sativa subsp. indica TaxID=39946 RepID=B8AIU9_ORYSI|nr:hypothetical protein OsI_08939 [Oryza sativa Indica Group]